MIEVITVASLIEAQLLEVDKEVENLIKSFNWNVRSNVGRGGHYVYMSLTTHWTTEQARKRFFDKVRAAGYHVVGWDTYAKAYFNKPANIFDWLLRRL